MKAWKELEKEVAHVLGGKRNIRVGYHDRVADIDHPIYSIECKYGKQVPKYLMVDYTCGFVVGTKKSHTLYVLIPSHEIEVSDILAISMRGFVGLLSKRKAEFIRRGLAQAKGYGGNGIPLLCVKRPYQRGFVAILDAGSA